MKYHIITGDRHEVEAEVNQYLREGWHLHGNIQMYHTGMSCVYTQVVTKVEIVDDTMLVVMFQENPLPSREQAIQRIVDETGVSYAQAENRLSTWEATHNLHIK